jgi:hypothetical protein
MTPQTIVQDQMAAERAAHDRALGMTFQDLRNLAGDVAPMVTTGAGVAFGAPAGLPGMAAGGAVGAAAGARARQLLRGDPEPTTSEKVGEVVSGAVSGLAGGVLQRGVNVFLRAFRATPNTKLSLDMQGRAKEAERAFREAAKAAGKPIEGRGFKAPEAVKLYRESKALEMIEGALARSRGQPDRVREQFVRLTQSNNKVMARLTPEQQALLYDVTRQSSPAAILRTIGDLRNTLIGGVGGTLVRDPATGAMIAGAQMAAGGAGRLIDRAATNRMVDAAMAGISGVAPAASSAPTGIASLGAGLAQPAGDPLARALVERQMRERTKP